MLLCEVPTLSTIPCTLISIPPRVQRIFKRNGCDIALSDRAASSMSSWRSSSWVASIDFTSSALIITVLPFVNISVQLWNIRQVLSSHTIDAKPGRLKYDFTLLFSSVPFSMQFSFHPSTARLPFIVLVVIALGSTLVLADQKTQKEKQLQALQSKIKKLKQTIDVKQDSKSRYAAQLRKIEGQIGQVSKKINSTRKEISKSKDELKKLRRTRKQHQKKLVQESDILAQQIYAAYTLGKQEKIKLLFSQKDPSTLQRNLVFYQYFSEARVNLINDVQHSITTILSTESQISQTSQTLEKSYQLLKNQKSELGKDSAKRKTIISSLSEQLKKQGGHLGQLQDEASQLQNLIDSIEEILIDIPEPELNRQAFAALRGKLAWPVKGKLKRLFGRRKPQSDLRWQGIMIEAPSGRHIRAVSHGRVAFADWLRGLGNLIIIDHGNSYLSLYGHNESLYKTAGEWVEPGDIISSVGNSGGQSKSGLYFEIRKRGKPQNPTKWCKSGNQFASR